MFALPSRTVRRALAQLPRTRRGYGLGTRGDKAGGEGSGRRIDAAGTASTEQGAGENAEDTASAPIGFDAGFRDGYQAGFDEGRRSAEATLDKGRQ
ncbi:hypothetical protein GGF46_001506 [Coemansia sp. RSA 552]|nr:hypothetical protein GGF46_001506 [Coemansia sp. RSA 552]